MGRKLIVKDYLEFSNEAFVGLTDFLIGREHDIADELEDFGELKKFFKELFDVEAEVKEE